MSQGYPLPASEAEVARLRMQSDLFRDDAESMLDRIGVSQIMELYSDIPDELILKEPLDIPL